MPYLHEKFRDRRFERSTNYEKLMLYLDERRAERQRKGPEEIQDWSDWTVNQRRQVTKYHDQPHDYSKIPNGRQSPRRFPAVDGENARLCNDLQHDLRNQIVDVDVVANRFRELSFNNDQITFDKVVKVVRENNLEFDSNLLSRWIKYSRTSYKNTCSIDRLVDILRRAINPFSTLDNRDLSDEDIFEDHNQKILLHSSQMPMKFRKNRINHYHSKKKNLEKLKHALYESLQQHAGMARCLYSSQQTDLVF